jgi:type II secretory pathway pseudopilin PulG
MSAHRIRTGLARSRSAGVVLLAMLLAVALGGIAMMAAADVWALARRRAQEQELLFVGGQYRLAIQRYVSGAPPGTGRTLPATLEDLLEDDRYPIPVHHLRRLYPDPITGSTEWGTLRSGDRITGVYSLSEQEPLKQAGFAAADALFAGKTSYRDWVFAPAISGRFKGVNPPAANPPASGVLPSNPPTPARRR